MSGQNVEVVGAAVAELNRGDWGAALARAAPEFEYDLSRTASPLQGVYPRERMREVVEEFVGSWESVRYEPEQFIEEGDHVVVPFTTHFRGRQGIEMRTQATWVWTVRDGEIARLALYQDRDEALEAAGLPSGRE